MTQAKSTNPQNLIELPGSQKGEKHTLLIAQKQNGRLWVYTNIDEIPVGEYTMKRINVYTNSRLFDGSYYFYVGNTPLILHKKEEKEEDKKTSRITIEVLWDKENGRPGIITKTKVQPGYIFTDCTKQPENLKCVSIETHETIKKETADLSKETDLITKENKKQMMEKGVEEKTIDFIFSKIDKKDLSREVIWLNQKVESIEDMTPINEIPRIFPLESYYVIRYFIGIIADAGMVTKENAELIQKCMSRNERLPKFIKGLPRFYNLYEKSFLTALEFAMPYAKWASKDTKKLFNKPNGTLSDNPILKDLKNGIKGSTSKS